MQQSKSERPWEQQNPDADWEKLYKENPDVDFGELFNSLPEDLTKMRTGDGEQPEDTDDPRINKEELGAYKNMLLKMMHGKETMASVDGMLKSGDPLQAIPQTANQLSQQAQAVMKKAGKPVSLSTIIGGSIVLAAELIEIGTTAGYFELDEQKSPMIVEGTTKAIIKTGLENQTIDPVELQTLFDEEMTDDQRASGLIRGEGRVPADADQNVAMEQYARRRESQAIAKQGGMLNGA